MAVTAQANNPDIALIFMQDLTGMQTARSHGTLGDRSQRWWFKKVMADRQPFVSKPYYSLTGNIVVTSVFLPIYDPSQTLKGIFGMDIKLDTIQEVVEKFSSDTSYAFVVDGEGNLVAHPDRQRIAELYNYLTQEKTILARDASGNVLVDVEGTRVTQKVPFSASPMLVQSIKKAIAGETNFVSYENAAGEPVYSYYRQISLPGDSDNWGLITIEKVADAERFIQLTRQINFVFAGLSILLVISVLYFIVGRVVKRVEGVSASLDELAHGEGDLTQRLPLQGQDEVRTLSHYFNVFMDKLQAIISDIKGNAQTVAQGRSDLSQSSVHIADAFAQQAQQINQVAEATTEINHASAGVDAAVGQGESAIADVGSSVANGDEQLHRVVSEMATISDDVTRLGDTVDALATASKDIGDILAVINDIAAQTNLLALNASIESARAGEQGRGFAVVADEVRTLAQRTQNSTQAIDGIVAQLQTRTQQAAQQMQDTRSRVATGVDKAGAAQRAFQEVVGSIAQLTAINGNIKTAVAAQTQAIQSIDNNAHSISQGVEQSTASLLTMRDTIAQLRQQADQLLSAVDRFKLH